MCICGNIHMSGVPGMLNDSLEKEKANSKKGLLQSKLISVRGCCELNQYDFLYAEGPGPDTVHPNLWEHAVSENVYAGTAMSRRAVYQMGGTLKPGITGHVDCGLGKLTTQGGNSIIEPTKEIGFDDYGGKKYYEVTCGEVPLQIQYTPGTEAPAEMNVYLPEQKVLFIAENCAGTLHNALTPRGAQVRDLLAWAGFLDETIVTFSDMEIVCSAHSWPHFGREESIRFIEIQRDMYRYVNNATLHLVNLGYTIDEVGRMISGEDGTMPLPEAFANEWCSHGFYGTYNHDAKAVYQRYIGWYDGNPAHLNRHKPMERATRYVDAFGAETILEKAKDAHNAKDYEWAAELFDLLMNAEEGKVLPSILKEARGTYADTLRNMGYGSEAATWRNMYLTGAQEIELGGTVVSGTLTFADDTINAMTLEMILQYMGIMLDSRKVEKDKKRLAMSVSVTAVKGTEYGNIQVDRGILRYRIVSGTGELASGADIVVKGNKLDFFRAFVDNNRESLKKVVADAAQEEQAAEFISGYLTRFPIGFPVMTPRDTYTL